MINKKLLATDELMLRLKRFSFNNTANESCQPFAKVESKNTSLIDALVFIDAHFSEIRALQEVADAVGVHSKYLSQRFRQLYGIRAWEYVLRLRIHAAQRLLLTTNQKVASIAYEVGFESISAFYAAFQKYSPEVSPKILRKIHIPKG